MLAAASIGATFSTCSPDFGAQGVLDRFGQIAPAVLFAADGYFYNGKEIDSLGKVREIAERLPSLKRVVVVPYLSDRPDVSAIPAAQRLEDFIAARPASGIRFEQLPFEHPVFLWNDRGTQVHRARGRRRAAQARLRTAAALRREARRSAVLFHHARLDDVELARLGARLGRDAAAL
jgi:acetoacetyl-CoA synthetase